MEGVKFTYFECQHFIQRALPFLQRFLLSLGGCDDRSQLGDPVDEFFRVRVRMVLLFSHS
jgi:hypothetical protein